jgi:PST family polysaccharide transporter
MALNGFGLWSLVAQRLVLSAVFSVWSWSACQWLPRVRLSVTEARGLVAFGKSVLIGEVTRPLHLRLFDVLLGHALGPSAVGWFRLAMRCFEFLVKALSLPLVRVSLPTLSRLTDAPVALRETLSRQLKLGALVALPAFCGAAVLAEDLLVAVFGTRWQPSVAVFQVLCVSGLPLVFERLGWVALTAVGKPEWVARANLLLLAVMAVIAWLCAPYGPVVVAGAFVLRSVIVVPTIAWLLCKVRALEFGAWLGQIGRVFVAALLATALAAAEQALLISSLGLPRGVLAIALSSLLVYVVLIKALAPAQFREAIEIWRLIRHGQALRN